MAKGGFPFGKKAAPKGGAGARMAAFEKSGRDVDPKGMKEGSKADMALDQQQMGGFRRGGKARKR